MNHVNPEHMQTENASGPIDVSFCICNDTLNRLKMYFGESLSVYLGDAFDWDSIFNAYLMLSYLTQIIMRSKSVQGNIREGVRLQSGNASLTLYKQNAGTI